MSSSSNGIVFSAAAVRFHVQFERLEVLGSHRGEEQRKIPLMQSDPKVFVIQVNVIFFAGELIQSAGGTGAPASNTYVILYENTLHSNFTSDLSHYAPCLEIQLRLDFFDLCRTLARQRSRDGGMSSQVPRNVFF